MKYKIHFFIILILITTLLFSIQSYSKEYDSDTHKHKESITNETDKHEHENEENEIVLTESQKKTIGIKLAKVSEGVLHHEITVTGEIRLNEDKLVRIVPRVSGIIHKVFKTLGDKVKKGELLSIVDSPELGEAKSDYYEKYNQLSFSKVDYKRALKIEANTNRLLKDLKKLPPLTSLQNNSYGNMGSYRANLLSSYAEYRISKKIYERRKKLYNEKITSENSFLEAFNNFEKARAAYKAEIDNAEFEVKQNRFLAERAYKLNQLKLKSAERKLLIFGLNKHDIKQISSTKGSELDRRCIDKHCLTSLQHNVGEHFSKSLIIAPESGTIIRRDVSSGEKVDTENPILEVADLKKVWAVFQIPSRDISLLNIGDEVIVTSSAGNKTRGKISVISPIVNGETRAADVRVVIENEHNNLWKPGLFVTGYIDLSTDKVGLIVPKKAIQIFEGKEIVFVADEHGYEVKPVVTGRADRENIEIIAGLQKNDLFVAKGAFELKAQLVTTSLGAHAGHSH